MVDYQTLLQEEIPILLAGLLDLVIKSLTPGNCDDTELVHGFYFMHHQNVLKYAERKTTPPGG